MSQPEKLNFTGQYGIRDAVEGDKNFILATFLRGLYYGDSWFSQMPKDIFMSNYKKVADELVAENKTTIKIACLNDSPDVILGYSILSKDYNTVVWVFVKKDWRKGGIGRSLIPNKFSSVLHLTTLGKNLLNKFENVIFNPFSL